MEVLYNLWTEMKIEISAYKWDDIKKFIGIREWCEVSLLTHLSLSPNMTLSGLLTISGKHLKKVFKIKKT